MDQRLKKCIDTSIGNINGCLKMNLLHELANKHSLSHAEHINWKRVTMLSIIGTEAEWPVRRDSVFGFEWGDSRRGCYINSTGSWVLLVGTNASNIRKYLDKCGDNLTYLLIGYTNMRSISIPSELKLREIHLIYNSCLVQVPTLGLQRRLQVLDLQGSKCNFGVNLAWFSELRELDLEKTEIYRVSLEQTLNNLRLCNLNKSKLKDMDFLAFCPAIEYLCLNGTEIQEIPEGIRFMEHLHKLYLEGLSLKMLPAWLPELGLSIGRSRDCDICLRSTQVAGVDMSIFEQSQAMIRDWFKGRSQEEAGSKLNEIKVVFLGDGSTGKSLTVNRLLNDGAKPETFDGEATPGIAIEDRSYTLQDGRNVQVHFWDFGGQEILHSMHRIFLTDRTLYVVMINARNNTQDDQARYWLHNVSSFAPGCPVLLVLNQIDQNPNASINERGLRKLYPNLRRVLRLSALTFDQNTFNRIFTENMLAEIAEFESLGTFFPNSWKKVMDQIRGMKGNYIKGDEFYRICRTHGIDGSKLCLDLLKWFNDIGISFCCSDSPWLRDYVVLKPEWITNAIYTIIWNKRSDTTNGMVARKEIFRLLVPEQGDSIKRVRSDMNYKLEDVDYVLNITRQFRLSFLINDEQEFIPMLCNANALSDVENFLDDTNVIEFRLEYEYLPNNVIHRLMVDMRNNLCKDKVWLTGAFFHQEYNEVSALVKSEGNVLFIYIKATDPEHKAHTYLNTIRTALRAIHEDMGLKTPTTLVGYTEEGRTEYFEYIVLEGARRNGQYFQFSKEFRRMISIDEILNGSDSIVVKKKEKLLRDIAKLCVQLQGNRIMLKASEDERNDILRDGLRNLGYYTADQTRIGSGRTGRRSGYLDLQILHEDQLPWTNLEAMKLKGVSDSQIAYWNDHLNRLVDNYNPGGMSSLFLINYIDCAPNTFSKICGTYIEHMRKYSPPKCELRHGSLSEIPILKEEMAYLRVFQNRYDLEGTPITVYHYFVGFTQGNQDEMDVEV